MRRRRRRGRVVGLEEVEVEVGGSVHLLEARVETAAAATSARVRRVLLLLQGRLVRHSDSLGSPRSAAILSLSGSDRIQIGFRIRIHD